MILDTMPFGYAQILAMVMTNGHKAKSRGMATREVVGPSIDLTRPSYSLATGTGRGLNLGIACVEACQLIAGESYPQLLSKVSNGAFERYKDGDVLHGAYGPRIRPQLETVIRRLRTDPGSRQAVVTIWDPSTDQQDDRRDLPCTVSFQFLVRGGMLHMITYMRSNDAWLGLPYDFFQFTQLQLTLAWALDLPCGTYMHRVGSLHLYEEHVELSKDVYSGGAAYDPGWHGARNSLYLDMNPIARWGYARTAADLALRGLALGEDDSRLLQETAAIAKT